MIDNAGSLEDLKIPSANHLEPFQRDIFNVEIADYH